MAKDIVSQSMKMTIIIGALFFSLLAQKATSPVAWGFLFGVFFSVLNFYLLLFLFQNIFTPVNTIKPIWKRAALISAFLKIPVLYGLIIFLLSQFHLSPFSLMIGFSFPFLVLLLKAIGQALEGDAWKRYGKRTGIIRTA